MVFTGEIDSEFVSKHEFGNMYFLASRNARCFSAFHTDVLAFVA